MVHEERLSALLSEFARTLATDLPIQGILDHLVGRIVEVLPITAAGVTLISAGTAPHYIAASDESALHFERLQAEMGQGPCLAAYQSGEAVAVPDLRFDERFPQFGAAALAAGLAAVFTLPLRHGDGRLGALDLYRDTPGELDPEDMTAAHRMADVAAAYVINAEAREQARVTSDQFRYMALHDPLTGLPNRLLLAELLEHAAQRAERSHTDAAILFADLDRFKQINDTHGHQVGDELLLAVAHRLSGLVRPSDTLARVSGDEFVFVCEDLHDATDVEVLARRVDEAFSRPFVVRDVELTISASVGIAFAGPGQDISDRLVAEADIAMYQAKRKNDAGHHIVDLREVLDIDTDGLETDLRSAFAQDKLDIAYQPIVRSTDGLVMGVEALLRWTHPDRGAVPAMAIVALAEESELIGEIGAWVLERACRDRGRWLHDHPGAPLDLAVNVSARQLMSPEFGSTVSRVLASTAMDPSALVLELTENIFVEDREPTTTTLVGLKAAGIGLALDDFGTGYSSLNYLRRLPIDIVKIDRSFIADIGHTPMGSALVAAVTHLAHDLGLSVTAEGVETQVQRDEVSAIGCESAQGFFFARPMPAVAIGAHLGAMTGRPAILPSAPSLN